VTLHLCFELPKYNVKVTLWVKKLILGQRKLVGPYMSNEQVYSFGVFFYWVKMEQFFSSTHYLHHLTLWSKTIFSELQYYTGGQPLGWRWSWNRRRSPFRWARRAHCAAPSPAHLSPPFSGSSLAKNSPPTTRYVSHVSQIYNFNIYSIFYCKYKSVHYLSKSLHNNNDTSSVGKLTNNII